MVLALGNNYFKGTWAAKCVTFFTRFFLISVKKLIKTLKINKKKLKTSKKSISTSFPVHTAPKSWAKYTTFVNLALNLIYSFHNTLKKWIGNPFFLVSYRALDENPKLSLTWDLLFYSVTIGIKVNAYFVRQQTTWQLKHIQ